MPGLAAPAPLQTFTVKDYLQHQWTNELVHFPISYRAWRTPKSLTLRDAAGLDPGFRAAVDQGLVRGPRLLLSITPLAQSGGSSSVYGPGPEQPMERNALGIYPEICDGADQVRAVGPDSRI